MDFQERFWNKVVGSSNGCWIWTGATDGARGYGIVRRSKPRRIEVAQRVAYGLLIEDVPKGRKLARDCSDIRCVNPTHHRLGPPLVCPKGHPYEGDNLWVSKDGSRTCRICHRDYQRERSHDPTQRAKNNARGKAWRTANPDHAKILLNRGHRKSRAKHRARLDTLKAGLSCIICGETHPACLDFHHRDATTKTHNATDLGRAGRFDLLISEIAKCDVLCSNCHRKVHHNERREDG